MRYKVKRFDPNEVVKCFWTDNLNLTDKDYTVWDNGTCFALGVIVCACPHKEDAELICNALNMRDMIKRTL